MVGKILHTHKVVGQGGGRPSHLHTRTRAGAHGIQSASTGPVHVGEEPDHAGPLRVGSPSSARAAIRPSSTRNWSRCAAFGRTRARDTQR